MNKYVKKLLKIIGVIILIFVFLFMCSPFHSLQWRKEDEYDSATYEWIPKHNEFGVISRLTADNPLYTNHLNFEAVLFILSDENVEILVKKIVIHLNSKTIEVPINEVLNKNNIVIKKDSIYIFSNKDDDNLGKIRIYDGKKLQDSKNYGQFTSEIYYYDLVNNKEIKEEIKNYLLKLKKGPYIYFWMP